MNPYGTIRQPHCSFCNKAGDAVERLIAGPDGVFICNECVALCNSILQTELGFEAEEENETLAFRVESKLAPRELKVHLDEYVIGQDYAKQILAVAVYNHYKRINAAYEGNQAVELDKSNILLIGPTGSGKTLLAQTLARVLDVPFCIVDATALTEAGYVGEDVENILLRLIQAADYDIARAQKGIIYVDEIDKTARKGADNPSITRDVSGEGVQQALLKIIEGTVANVPPQGGRKHPHQDFIQIDTRDILFICAGAFSSLDDIIAKRLGTKNPLGFVQKTAPKTEAEKTLALLEQIASEDLLQFGLIPEFVGRLPVVASVQALTEDDMIRILTEPKNAIVKQYQHLFELDGVQLEFTKDALLAIAQKALTQQTGARGLRGIIEKALLEVMFEIPSSSEIAKVTVTAKVIEGTEKPTLINTQGKKVRWGRDGKPKLDSAA